jgi:hypothetical protein
VAWWVLLTSLAVLAKLELIEPWRAVELVDCWTQLSWQIVFVVFTSNGRDFLLCRQLLMPRRWRQTAVIECPVALLRASRRPYGDDTVLCHHPPHLGPRNGVTQASAGHRLRR